MSHVYGDGVSMNYLKSAHLVLRRVLSDVEYPQISQPSIYVLSLHLRHFNDVWDHESQITAKSGNIPCDERT
jgi:hypothetical protein